MPPQIDPSRMEFYRLTEDNIRDTKGFTCSDKDLDEFIHDESLDYQSQGLGITHLFYYEKEFVGFITLSMASVIKESLPKTNIPSRTFNSYPALLIGRLGVKKDNQHRKIGTCIYTWARSMALTNLEWVGCLFLIVDSKLTATGFYKSCGFVPLVKQDSKDHVTMISLLAR